MDIGTLVIVVLNGMRPLSIENREIESVEKREIGVAAAANVEEV